MALLVCFLSLKSDILYAEDENELRSKVESSYSEGKKTAGVTSFHGYCTKAAARQMEQVGSMAKTM